MTNGVVALSTEWNQLNSIVPGCPVYYLPNGIDLSTYRNLGLSRIAGTKYPLQLKVLYLGYIGKSKGSFDLIEAAGETMSQKVPAIFDLVGEDVSPGEVEQIKKQIEQTGLGNVVTLHPTASDAKKIDFFREADIFIYPSYSEGMPIAVIEAMACGLPVIATRVGGLPDLVTDGINGILVDAGHPDQLMSALKSLSLKPDLRVSMQLNSYQRAFDEYEIEKHVTRLVDIYGKTLAIA
jgi:glycosyltransferase involved in cell wall biosynthesis